MTSPCFSDIFIIEELKEKLMSKVQMLLVILIVVASVFLRFHNYAVYPQRGATSDEYTYAFLGVSLLTKGVPISWSSFLSYKEKIDLIIDRIYFPIVKPYFDHPPLNGLVIGSWALLFGENSFEKITLSTIRLASIILATISAFLLFLISNTLYGYKVGIWALTLYSTVTIFIMNARVVVAENLLTPLMLGAIYVTIKFLEKKNVKYLVIVGILCGLAILTKIVGIVVFLATCYILLLNKIKRKHICIFVGTFLLFLLSLLLYGAYFDWGLFWAIQQEQAGRPIGPQTLFTLIRQPTIVNTIFHDGWYYLGFFALFTSFMDIKKHIFIVVYSFVYLFLLLATLNSDGLSGWYLLPMFPLMALAIALFLHKGMYEASWAIIVFVVFIGLFQIQMLLHLPFGLSQSFYRVLLITLFTPFLLLYLRKNKRQFQVLAELWFYLFLLGNIVITYNYIHPA